MVSFSPVETESNKVFSVVVWLTPEANSSDCVIVIPDTSTSETPLQLLGGIPVNDQVGLSGEKYFVLNVQPGLAKDVTIIINSLSGDPDIYVNPASRGFYHRGSIYSQHPDPAAAWSSTQAGTLADSLVISHSDDLFTSANGNISHLTVICSDQLL
jgi:hypothetical protein